MNKFNNYQIKCAITLKQMTHNQVLILKTKHKNYCNEIQRLRKQISELNKERIKTKKQMFEYKFQRDLSENNIKSIQNELLKAQNELKLKNQIFVRIENERRKMQIQIQKNINNQKLLSRSSSHNDISVKPENRNEKQIENERKLLNNGLLEAYNASKASQDIDKTLILQRLLLAKVKQLAEKEVILEEYQKQFNQMKQHINRLKQTKLIAEELTDTRHKLNIKTNQINVRSIDLDFSQINNFQIKFQQKFNKIINYSICFRA
jgi:hypothetical protein